MCIKVIFLFLDNAIGAVLTKFSPTFTIRHTSNNAQNLGVFENWNAVWDAKAAVAKVG